MSALRAAPKHSIRAGEREESVELEDVPAAVVCAHCGRAECSGCAPDLEESTHASKVVAIVPWERPGLGLVERLWGTAKLATLSADTFFGRLPDGPILPALRFGVAAELFAVSGLCVLTVPLVMALAPTLVDALREDPSARSGCFSILSMGIPCTAGLMVLLHAAHGVGLDLGARRGGGRGRPDRGLRFGLYACGWDLVTLPLGLLILFFNSGPAAAARTLPLGIVIPRRAAQAYLRRGHQLDERQARRACRFASRVTLALLLALIAGSFYGLHCACPLISW